MKKIIFLSIMLSLFLFGCGVKEDGSIKTVQQINLTETNTTEIEELIDINTVEGLLKILEKSSDFEEFKADFQKTNVKEFEPKLEKMIKINESYVKALNNPDSNNTDVYINSAFVPVIEGADYVNETAYIVFMYDEEIGNKGIVFSFTEEENQVHKLFAHINIDLQNQGIGGE